VGVAEDIVISMVVFLFLSLRNTDGTVFQGANSGSTDIPVDQSRSFKTPGKTPLEIIEVQSKSYLGDDDFFWLVDLYEQKK
jgi:hypothetical protein